MKTTFNKIFKLIVFTFLMIIANDSFAQNLRIDPNPNQQFKNCDLGEKNKIWWEQIVSETDTIKMVEMIKNKIISDTLYKRYNPEIKTASRPSINDYYIDQDGNLCDMKILFVVKYNKQNSLILDVLKNPKYLKFFNEINSENTEIFLLPAAEGGVALYGVWGSSGVVHMTITDEKLKQKIEKIRNTK